MKPQRLVIALLAFASTAVHADVIKDNLNYSMTAKSSDTADADCRKWTEAPIRFSDGKSTVDVGRLALAMVADAAAYHSGGSAFAWNSHVCDRGRLASRP
ncbi:hypothetical protein [Paraburkholderia rhizosphaerae]|uniref:Uncharacterized protein n=1 Tax=Paraburkholderia rhizosphaerae TaxID=480658 RepID=A0A4V3HCI4_9BURK|nr:hypothetical protein [Paraburkholderia rhizosphaerae]TDY37194.1 hypothetical protein BX592_14235 [Paraburkholderia rhizosphaerae]